MTTRYIVVTVKPDPDQDDCLAAAERAYLDERPGLRGYDLEPRWADDSREAIELTVPAAASGEHHWIAGGGMVGCLYDCGPIPCETLDEALDELTDIYDLTTDERNQLRWHKHLGFKGDRGADYCEITVHDGPCPDESEASLSLDPTPACTCNQCPDGNFTCGSCE